MKEKKRYIIEMNKLDHKKGDKYEPMAAYYLTSTASSL